jgi:hypothetical protein
MQPAALQRAQPRLVREAPELLAVEGAEGVQQAHLVASQRGAHPRRGGAARQQRELVVRGERARQRGVAVQVAL